MQRNLMYISTTLVDYCLILEINEFSNLHTSSDYAKEYWIFSSFEYESLLAMSI